MNKIEISSIKLNGYYYGNISDDNSGNMIIFLLYNNGVCYSNFKTVNIDEINNNAAKIEITEDMYKSKSGWGIYSIVNDKITIQNWTFSSGCKSILNQSGEVKNDTSFVIKEWKNSKDRSNHQVNSIFKFKKYNPKPDGTNQFIQ